MAYQLGGEFVLGLGGNGNGAGLFDHVIVGHHIAVLGQNKAGACYGGTDGLAPDSHVRVAGDGHHAAHIFGVDLGGGQPLLGLGEAAGAGNAVRGQGLDLPLQRVHLLAQGGALLFPGGPGVLNRKGIGKAAGAEENSRGKDIA